MVRSRRSRVLVLALASYVGTAWLLYALLPPCPRFTLHDARSIHVVGFAPTGEIVTLHRDVSNPPLRGPLCLRSVSTGDVIASFLDSCKPVGEVAICNDGRWLSAFDRAALELVVLQRDGSEWCRIKPRLDSKWPLTHPRFSPDGRILLYTAVDDQGKGCIELHEVADRRVRATLPGAFLPYEVSEDGQLLASGDSFLDKPSPETPNQTKLWKLPTGELIGTIQGYEGVVGNLAFSPDGKLLVTNCSSDLRGEAKPATQFSRLIVWDVATQQEFRRFDSHVFVGFLDEGRLLLGGSWDKIPHANRLHVWQLPDLEEVVQVRHTEDFPRVSANGNPGITKTRTYFAANTTEAQPTNMRVTGILPQLAKWFPLARSKVTTYDATTGKSVGQVVGRPEIHFSPDGQSLLVRDESPPDNLIHCYDVPPSAPWLAVLLWPLVPTVFCFLILWLLGRIQAA